MWMFYLFAIAFGFSYGGLGAIPAPLMAGLFGLRSLGTLLGIAGFTIQIGGAIGSVLAGAIFDITGSYYIAFLIFGLSQSCQPDTIPVSNTSQRRA
jgi:MFS family permease